MIPTEALGGQQPNTLDWTQMSLLDAALTLAAAGLHVFPVDHPELPQCAGVGANHDPATCSQRGKHPAVAWAQHATTNPKLITTWFMGLPRNVGIHCGRSNLVVIDEDKLGEFQRYADEHGVQIPPTFVVATSKGRHYYFAAREDHPLSNEPGVLRKYSIDVRAGNGYVVAPGSMHATGVAYGVEVAQPPAPLPDWVIDAVTAKAATNGSSGEYDTPGPAGQGFVLPEVIKDGSRDGTLHSYASSLRARGIREAEAKVLMWDAWSRCEQPPVARDSFTWEEARGKLRGAYDRYAEGPSPEYQRDSKAGNGQSPEGATTARRARITWASEIEPQPVVWAWRLGDEGRIPAGSLSIAGGREGTGKSSFGILQSAHITRGELPGSFFGKPRRVLYVAIEDSWKYTLVPRLIAAGADRSKVGRFDVVTIDGDEVSLSLPLDNLLLEQEIVAHEIALVVIDPIMSVISDRIDTHVTRDVRRALDPLAKMADRTGAVILGIAHFNKASGTDAATLLSGSHAFRDVPRSVFGFARDDSDGTRVMTQVKNSLGRDDLPSLSYSIKTVEVETKLGLAETGKFVFTGESERSVADVLRDGRGDDDQTERDEATAWLIDYMKEQGGTAPAGEVISAASKHGISKTTLTRARNRAKVRSVKGGMTGGWVWSLGNAPEKPLEESTEETEETGDERVDSSDPSADSSGGQEGAQGVCPSCDRSLALPNKHCSANEVAHRQVDS